MLTPPPRLHIPGPDVVLFVALLCATRGLPTLWALLEVLFVGAAARWVCAPWSKGDRLLLTNHSHAYL